MTGFIHDHTLEFLASLPVSSTLFGKAKQKQSNKQITMKNKHTNKNSLSSQHLYDLSLKCPPKAHMNDTCSPAHTSEK